MASERKIKKFEDLQDIDLEHIYAFIESGSKEIPPSIEEYLQIMDKIRGMHLRIDHYGGKDAIVNHLIKVEGLSRYLANKAYNQAMEYFYADSDISKEAWLNICIHKMERNISLAQNIMKDVNDIAKVNTMIKDLRDTVILARPEKVDLPEGVYAKPNKFYTLSMEDLGKTPQSKKELKEFIQGLPEISEKVKELVMQEAMLKPINFLPEENEDPRKS